MSGPISGIKLDTAIGTGPLNTTPIAIATAGGGSDLSLSTADLQQDCLDEVTSTAVAGEGTYTWSLFDPQGVDRTALLSSTTADTVTWTPTAVQGNNFNAGLWRAKVTDGVVELVHTVQVGDDAGYIYLDTSLGTITDTNSVVNAAASTEGKNFTYVTGLNHGALDSGLDAYTNLQQLTPIPTNAASITCRIVLDEIPPIGPTANTCGLEMLVSNTSGLTAATGYHCGWAIDSINDVKMRGPSRVSGIGSLSAAIGITSTGHCDLTVVFNGTAAVDSFGRATGDAGDAVSLTHSTDSAGVFNEIWIGPAVLDLAGVPGRSVTWSGKMGYRWEVRAG